MTACRAISVSFEPSRRDAGVVAEGTFSQAVSLKTFAAAAGPWSPQFHSVSLSGRACNAPGTSGGHPVRVSPRSAAEAWQTAAILEVCEAVPELFRGL